MSEWYDSSPPPERRRINRGLIAGLIVVAIFWFVLISQIH